LRAAQQLAVRAGEVQLEAHGAADGQDGHAHHQDKGEAVPGTFFVLEEEVLFVSGYLRTPHRLPAAAGLMSQWGEELTGAMMLPT
jgi:hypothetical protein